MLDSRSRAIYTSQLIQKEHGSVDVAGSVAVGLGGVALAEHAPSQRSFFPSTSRLRIHFQRSESSYAPRSRVPRIAQPSIWKDIIPQSWRRRAASSKNQQKGRYTNNYFIWIYILIGSQAIRIMNVKIEADKEHRLADIKLRQLRKVIEKLERGEDVDVEKVLGTGDEASEQEWEEALRELESEERLWQNNRSRRRAEQHKKRMEEMDANPVNDDEPEHHDSIKSSTVGAPSAPAFY